MLTKQNKKQCFSFSPAIFNLVEPTVVNQRTYLVDNQQLTSQVQHNVSTSQSQQQNRVQFVQRINAENYLKQQTFQNSPNVAPGWRRQLADGEIIYLR